MTKTLQEQLATELPVEFVEQRVQRGTGDAASVALTAGVFDLDAEDDLLVVPGDTPLLRAETLATLARDHREAERRRHRPHRHPATRPPATAASCATRTAASTTSSSTPTPTPEELEINEINTSIYCFRRGLLAPALRRLSPENAQGEYYLTDAVSVLQETGHTVIGVAAEDPDETAGVNDRAQLAERRGGAARAHQPALDARRRLDDRPRRGPTSTPQSSSSRTSSLLPGTMLQGRTVVGARLGHRARRPAHRHDRRRGRRRAPDRRPRGRRSATTPPSGRSCSSGPGTRLAAGRHVGTFVEIKNSDIGEGAKVPHLAYIGDAEIGDGANIGAGTITANYDGRREAPHEGREGRPDLVQHRPGRAGRGGRRGVHRRRRGGEPRRAAGRDGEGRARAKSTKAGLDRREDDRRLAGTTTGGRWSTDGAGRPRRTSCSSRGGATSSSARRSPSTSGSRSARSCSRRSPTASSTAATARASAAPTSSSSRATASRSTSGSWSS